MKIFAAAKRSLVIVFLFLNAFLTSQLAGASSSQCSEVFSQHSSAPKSIPYYLNQVKSARNQQETPLFLDPAKELETSQLWKGTKNAPRAIKETLLNSTALLDFQLLAADEGVVKLSGSGTFTSFRHNYTWRGKDLSTNIGMPIDAIIARSHTQSEMMVPENAEAVFIFMHGGGTKTTGHHVAASLSNFLIPYGIVVISIDAPHHAYGPRLTDLTPVEYYEYLRDFRHEFIPAGVPTFIGGHSMGGQHADNIMRLSDRKELGLKEAFAGLVNLSGPLDNAPGRSMEEKDAVEKEIYENEELMALVPEGERDLSVLLLTQGKISATSGISTQLFSGIVDWNKPDHKGKDYLPTLVVMGERDALYIGREKLFQEYVADLENTEVEIMGLRKDYKGQEGYISHMIFDHYRPETQEMETFHLMKEFIQKQIGSTTQGSGHPLFKGIDSASLGLIAKIVEEYYMNLAFRKFADQYPLFVKKGTAKIAKLGQDSGILKREVKALTKQIKTLETSGENPNELKDAKERLASLQIEIKGNTERLNSAYVPEGELAEFARENINRRTDIFRATLNLEDDKKKWLVELNQSHDRLSTMEKKLDRRIERKIDVEANPFTGSLAIKFKEHQEALELMIQRQEHMDKYSSAMVREQVSRDDYNINPSSDIIQIFSELDQAYDLYNSTLATLKNGIQTAILNGELTAPEENEMLLELWGSKEAFAQSKPTSESLMGRVETLSQSVEAVDLEKSKMRIEDNELLREYLDKITPGLYTLSTTTLAQEMEMSLEELIANSSHAQKLWKDWRSIWKERPPDQTTALY